MLLLLLKMFILFKLRLCHNKVIVYETFVKNVAIRYRNCGKSTGISMNNININYNDIITQFLLNTILHNFGISWTVETNHQCKYDSDKNNLYLIRGVFWYNC